MARETTITVPVYDKNRLEKIEALCRETDESKTDLIRRLVDEEFERQDVDLDDLDGDEEETSLVDEYDTEGDYTLEKDEIKTLIGEVEEINKEHIVYGEVPAGSDAIRAVEAMVRYETDVVSKDLVRQICLQVGLDSDYYLDRIPRRVMQKLGGDGKENETTVAEDKVEDIVTVAVKACIAKNPEINDKIEKVYGGYKSIDREDRLGSFRRTGNFANDVVLAKLKSMKRAGVQVDLTDETHDTVDDLVNWYVEEEDPKWGDNDGLREVIVEDLEDFVAD
jgi:hypothetical protein